MSFRASPESAPTDRVRNHAILLLAENPGLTREQLRSALADVFMPPRADGAPLSGPAQSGVIYTGFPYFASFRLVLRSLCWALRRNKSDVESIKAVIDEIVTELTMVR